ncbi:MAG TPA: DUF1549 domain-containing protein, partial [Gemmataceae bacterium]|nr:DUF1549 domain-containing protein [Gemmataceae bacterium]
VPTLRLSAVVMLLLARVVQAGPGEKKPATPAPKPSVLNGDAWTSVPVAPVTSREIDALVLKELKASGIKPAPLTTDEQFIRRVMLDLTGELPVPADVTEFVADKDTNKRSKLIDKLLASDEYAEHWARYWRDVISSRATNQQARLLVRSFEKWMTERIKENKSWGDITRALLTASGKIEYTDDGTHGDLYFLLSKNGVAGPEERAAETSRVFMGIQIQCAQCHDHPSDVWKREQFHELTAYFARGRERLVRDTTNKDAKQARFVGLELVSTPFGEHRMPSKTDPRQGTVMTPRFLDGKAPRGATTDLERRRALADSVVSKQNYWFAGAYVNRTWGELMGQSFYSPVDDMGPQKEAVLPAVLTRLAASFRATDYDMKALLRTVANTETYQRQIRPGESTSEHLHFAAAYPARLRADALWESLTGVLGQMGPPAPFRPGPGGGMFAGRFGLEAQFKDEFNFDPSTKSDEVEGSIPQALLLMNNPQINQKIQARGTNLLGRILTAYPDNDEALRMVYLRALARKPTDRETDRCRAYIAKAGSRAEAFEDILWALINSTEFQTKR